MSRMWRAAAPVMALFFALACGYPGGGTEVLEAELAEKELRIAALESQLAGCDCPTAADVAPAAPAARVAAAAVEPALPVTVGTGPGEIEVKATNAFKMLLDGKGMSYNIAKTAYIEKKVEPGVHVLEVQSPLRKVVHTQNIDVPAGKRVRFQWRELRGELETLTTVDAN